MFSGKFQKYITPKNVIFFVITVLLIVALSKIQDIAIMFFASFVIACSMEPLIQKIQAFAPKLTRDKASAIVLFGGILAICALFIPIIVIGGNEIKTFAISFPQYIDSLKHFLESNPHLHRMVVNHLDFGEIISSASNVSSKVIAETINLGKNLGSAFVYLLISTLIIYYFMTDKEAVKKAFLRMFPTQMREKTSDVYDSISQKIGSYVIAQITTMASVGIIVTVGLLILKVDYALLLGLITAVFDIIPVVGPAIAFVICMVAVYKYGPVILILSAIIFAGAQLVENNFVRPYVFGKLLNLHPLIIFLFLFIAAKYMGVIGVVFAPAIAATAVVLIEEVYMKSIE